MYRLCLRLVGPGAADDAFQATFLVLVRRAEAARTARSLGGWLVGVAGRVALQMNRAARRRSRHERAAAARRRSRHERAAADRAATRFGLPAEPVEPSRILDEELVRLPDRLREPVTLCLLLGRTQEQAALELDCTTRTVRRRLEEAKCRLRCRLERRGVAPVAAVGLVAGVGPATAAVPGGLCAAVMAAVRGGAVPAGVANLVSGVKLMSLSSLWRPVLAVVVAAGGVLSAAQFGAAGLRADPPVATAKESPPVTAFRPRPAELVLWSTSCRPEGIRPNQNGVGNGAVFAPDGAHVLTTGLGKTGPGLEDVRGEIRVRDTATGKVVHTLSGSSLVYFDVAISPDGRTVVASGASWQKGREAEGTSFIEVWDWGREKPRLKVTEGFGRTPGKVQSVLALAVSPSGKTVAAVDPHATVCAWNLASGEHRFQTGTIDQTKPELRRATAHRAALAFSSDGNTLTTADNFGRVRMLDAKWGELQTALQAPVSPSDTHAVDLSPGQGMVAAGQQYPKVTDKEADLAWAAAVWRLPVKPGEGITVQPLRVRQVAQVRADGSQPSLALGCVAISPDGKWVAGIGGKGSLRLFEAATGKEVAWAREQTNESVVRLVFSPDSKTLLLSGMTTLELWSVAELLKRKPE